MKARILTAIGIMCIGLPILFLSQYIIYPIASGLLSLCAVWELLRVIGMHKRYAISIPSFVIAFAMPFFAYELFFPCDKHIQYLLICCAVLFVYLLYLICTAVFLAGRLHYKDVTGVFTMVSYVTISFTSLSLIRYTVNGVYYLAMAFIAPWVCDIFAYFVGMLIGKHKLAPAISPKKTVEGAVGGVVFTVFAFILYGLIVELNFPVHANYQVLAVLGLVLPIVAQIGDLWASLIKREHGVKDYSNLLPGHGGIMDRFDSVFSTCTILLIACTVFPPFVAA